MRPERKPAILPGRARVALLAFLELFAGAASFTAPVRTHAQAVRSPTALVEETESRLIQLDVTVTGPREVVADLVREDFELKVRMRWLDAFAVDRHCTAPGDGTAGAGEPALRPVVRYLFYFDQPLLTLPGRARAMDVARQLVHALVTDGSEAMIVSNAARLTVIQEATDDPSRLLDALDRLENDRTQWDFYATEEDSRVARVVEVLNDDENVQRALSTARSFQREESARTDRSLRRLHIALARLSQVGSRKAVFYFADILRQNPGEHYVSFFGTIVQRSTSTVDDMTSGAFAAGVAFDQVLNEATAQGIRFYPVYAQGLVTPYDRERLGAAALTRAGIVPSSSRVRLRDAQNTLASMASETGGHAFLRGESPAKIAENVVEDFSCIYTLSFDPTGFPEDAPLRVVVRVLREQVAIEARGRLVVPSESSRLVSRLLGAFTTGQASDTDFGLRAHLVPTGFDQGEYAALLQIRAPGTDIPDASWQLGASVVGHDKVLDEVSATLRVRQPGVPLVLEHEISLRPGPHEIVAVAHESTTDYVLSEHVEVSWPDPNRQPVTCGPLVLLQPTPGAFFRAGATRTAGSLARAGDEPVTTTLPTALMGLVCRSRRNPGLLRVDRVLIGDTAVEFPALEFELAGERCAQIRDLIPANSLGPGPYRYLLRVLHDGAVLHEVTRDFVAATPEP